MKDLCSCIRIKPYQLVKSSFFNSKKSGIHITSFQLQ